MSHESGVVSRESVGRPEFVQDSKATAFVIQGCRRSRTHTPVPIRETQDSRLRTRDS